VATGMTATRPERVAAWCWLGLRCARLLVVLPLQLWRTWVGSRLLLTAFRRTVVPMVQTRISRAPRQREVEQRLSGWALQGGYLICSYARMIGRRDVDDLAVVAASFTRLYDDLLDERGGAHLGERLAQLFASKEVTPESDLEALVGDQFRWLEARLPASTAVTVRAHLGELHAIQTKSVHTGSAWDPEAIVQLTLAKGGAGMAILGGLLDPDANASDFAVLHQLGGVLQLIDDYDDAFEDKAVLTSAACGHVSFGRIAGELRRVSRSLADQYGDRPARSFVDGLCNWLVLVGLRHVLDRLRGLDEATPGVPRRRLAMITSRKEHVQ